MTRIKLLGVCLIAVFAFAAITATSAFAEEKTKMLPESGVTFKSKGGAGKLVTVGGSTIECESGAGSGTIESANLGKYETKFFKCKFLGGPCKTTGAAAEEIINKGTYHFWLALETLNGTPETLVGALVFLPEEAHITCVVLGFNQLILVKGCVAALATPLNTLTAITKDTFAQISNGVQLITRVLPQEATKEIECILLSEVNGNNKFEQSSLVGVAENETFKKGETAVTVLLMNPEGHE